MSNRTRFTEAKFTPLYAATPDPRGFFESVLGFGGLADTYIRVSSADQRRYFGGTPFARTALKVSEQGVVTLAKTKCFGTDSDTSDFIYDHDAKGFRQVWGERTMPLCAQPSLAV